MALGGRKPIGFDLLLLITFFGVPSLFGCPVYPHITGIINLCLIEFLINL
jgi:hypothetical protein